MRSTGTFLSEKEEGEEEKEQKEAEEEENEGVLTLSTSQFNSQNYWSVWQQSPSQMKKNKTVPVRVSTSQYFQNSIKKKHTVNSLGE